MRTAANIVELRRLLAERHPSSRGVPTGVPARPVVASGVPALDALLHGGWPQGRLSELVGAGPGSGSAQVLHALLHRLAAAGQFLALVDGRDSFDVDAVPPEVLSRLLWVRCTGADEALKAADILLRDRNIPVVVLDLKLNPAAQLRRIPSSVWHRFRRLIEHHDATLLVITPTQLVGGAHCRVLADSRLGLAAMTQPPHVSLPALRFELLRGAEDESTNALPHSAEQ
jgi:hypothetical protein